MIEQVAFSPDGEILATASADDTVRLRDVATGQQIGTPLASGNGSGSLIFYSVAFSPDGDILAAGDGDNDVQLWDVGLSDERRVLPVRVPHARRAVGVPARCGVHDPLLVGSWPIGPRHRHDRPDRAQPGRRRPDQRIPQSGLANAKHQFSDGEQVLARH
ncbi:MAG: WD40 repeat domain-containing protein, partial [Streptosporangiaceae bacterium]